MTGLTAVERAATAERMLEDEHDGTELVAATTKNLRRLLKGTAAEGAVPLLLAARDAHLAVAQPEPAGAEPAAVPGCQICFEAYGSARPSLELKPPELLYAPGSRVLIGPSSCGAA